MFSKSALDLRTDMWHIILFYFAIMIKLGCLKLQTTVLHKLELYKLKVEKGFDVFILTLGAIHM